MSGFHDSSELLSRRHLLCRVTAGLGVSYFLPVLDACSASRREQARPRSLITVWLAGGPSQLETWDPHPGTSIGGPTRAIDTSIPGLQIGADFPLIAEQLEHLSVIRSLVSKEGDHERATYYLKTGYRPDPTLKHPALGAIAAHELPDNSVEIPAHVSLGSSQWPARGGYLGDQFDAFKIYDPGRQIRNMTARVSDQRQLRRLENLEIVTREFRRGRETQVDQTMHEETVRNALTMMSSDQLKAFDLSEESASLVAAYGDSVVGRGCLVARRLVEQGVRAIEVTLPGFDTHAENFSGHRTQAAMLDPALATLVRDLHERQLLESTAVLCIGEFGRTPTINKLDGRDHWPHGFSCLVGGGGLNSGQVIGATDPEGIREQPDNPVTVADLYATVLAQLGIDFSREMITPIGRPMSFSDGQPIDQLLTSPKSRSTVGAS